MVHSDCCYYFQYQINFVHDGILTTLHCMVYSYDLFHLKKKKKRSIIVILILMFP